MRDSTTGQFSPGMTSWNTKDLIGTIFGKLTVQERIPVSEGVSRVSWRCLCECGRTTIVMTSNLTRKTGTKSCGKCLPYKVNLQGLKFGRLFVLTYFGYSAAKTALWFCICDCGNYHITSGNSLSVGNAKSCGCAQKEAVRQTGYKNKGREGLKGDKNPKWKGGVASFREKVKSLPQYLDWKISVFIRDNRTCQHCNLPQSKNVAINAHHLDFFSHIIDRYKIDTLEKASACDALWDVSNGITLCVRCHKKVHYGKVDK